MSDPFKWTEKDLERNTRQQAKLFGWAFYHTWNSRNSAAGYPDATLVRDGEIIFVEMKQDGKEPTEAQYVWLYDLYEAAERSNGAVDVWVLWECNFQEFVERLAR